MIEGPAHRPLRGSGWRAWAEQARVRSERLAHWFAPARQPADPFLARLQFGDRVMWLLLGALAVFLVADLLVRQPKLPSVMSPEPLIGTPLAAAPPSEPAVADVQAAVAARNPFNLSPKRDTSDLKGTSNKDRLLSMVKSLTLVGVNRSGSPEALIEDSEAKRTYFVKVGDAVNGLRVKAIDGGTVVLELEGETYQLQ